MIVWWIHSGDHVLAVMDSDPRDGHLEFEGRGGNHALRRNTPNSSIDLDARRARRTEQQRQRRAANRLATTAALGSIVDQEDARRARRAEQERRRRAIARSQKSVSARTTRIQTATNQRRQSRSVANDAVRVAREEEQARAALRRVEDTITTERLGDRILSVSSLTHEEVVWMSTGQRLTQDPRLALAYYYCCGVNPGSFVFGNECVRGDSGEPTRQRLQTLLDDYPKARDLAACQQETSKTSSEQTDIWACASCGHIVYETEVEKIRIRRLPNLPESFLLNEEEVVALVGDASLEFVRNYRQVYVDGDSIYYLIPDLVRDRDNIPLCEKCGIDPRTSKFSVASGHDCGRVTELPAVSAVALSCITPARCFGLELSLSKSSGHAIAFPSNGPSELSHVLPNLDRDCMPRVTFMGPLEEWRVQLKKFRMLYTIDPDVVYQWLHVLAKINTVFRDEHIVIEDSIDWRRQLQDMEAAIELQAHVAQSKTVTAVYDPAAFDETEDDECTGEGSGEVFVRNSVVLPALNENEGRAVHEIVDASIVAFDGHPGETKPPEQASTQETVIAVKRGRSPMVEWFEKAKLLAGMFPSLFLTGSTMLPSGSLPRDYVNHFMNYWDGRSEKSVAFAAVVQPAPTTFCRT